MNNAKDFSGLKHWLWDWDWDCDWVLYQCPWI